VKRIKSGFTIVELLTVVAIVALLIGVLLPALTYVRRSAKETQQKVQLTTIDLALTTFKNDYGDYPPSDSSSHDTAQIDYCGAQKLAEALLGRDLLGFHPRSNWSAISLTWYPQDPNESNLRERKGPYLELATASAFRLGKTGGHDGLFDGAAPLNEDTFVLCDVFSVRIITLANGKTVKAGTPILYYKANTSSKNIDNQPPDFSYRIYNVYDNGVLVDIKEQEEHKKYTDPDRWPLNPLSNPAPGDTFQFFYDYIRDPKIEKIWPYRPDSYILISAGSDGFYGTADDITNF
jgi:prepilin-type N-terminal cleavage/methylation domain-containing protein